MNPEPPDMAAAAPAPGAPEPSPANAPRGFVAADGTFTGGGWTDNAALREKFSSVQALAKSYEHLEQMVGKKGVLLPSENATAQEMDAFYNRLGRPERAEGYAYSPPAAWPSDRPLDTARLDAFRQAAHKAGLSQKQFSALVDWAGDYELGRYGEWQAQNAQRQAQRREAALEELRRDPEFGGDRLERTIAQARSAIARFGGQALAEDSAFGDDPRIVRLMARIGRAMGEDALARGEIPSGALGDAKARIARIMNDPNAPYWNASHPDHDAQVQEVSRLFSMTV